MTAPLLPCPFCGVTCTQMVPAQHSARCYFFLNSKRMYGDIDQPTLSEMHEAWNRRAPAVVTDAMVERAMHAYKRTHQAPTFELSIRAALEAAMRGEE
jgi:hypothetical protein